MATTINHRTYAVREPCFFLASRDDIDQVSSKIIHDISAVSDDRATEFIWLSVEEVTAVIDFASWNRYAICSRFILSLLHEGIDRIVEILSLAIKDISPTGVREVVMHLVSKCKKQHDTMLLSELWKTCTEYSCEYLRDYKSADHVFYAMLTA